MANKAGQGGYASCREKGKGIAGRQAFQQPASPGIKSGKNQGTNLNGVVSKTNSSSSQ
jgi:hypothetical protein